MMNKKITFLLLVSLSIAVFTSMAQDTMYIYQKVGGVLTLPVLNIDSIKFKRSTIPPHGDLSYIRSVSDEYLFASDAHADYNLISPAVSNGQALAIKSKSNALFGGKFVFKDDTDPTFGVNKCPSQPTGGYPLYHAEDGGYIHIYNGLNVGYAQQQQFSPDKPAVGEFYYVCRLYKSTTYEAIMSGFGAPELKVVGNSTQLQFSNGDYKTANQSFAAVVDRMRTVIFRFVYQNNQVSIYITDQLGDNRLLATLNIAADSFFRNFSIGTSSHPMTHDFFAYVMKFGSVFSPTEASQILADLKSVYPVGQKPDKPLVFPDLTYDGTYVNVTLNYQASSSGAAWDPAASTIRWYLLDYINASSGNGIDKQSILTTTTGNTLRIRLSDYPTAFPSGNPTKNGLAIDISCVDVNGNEFQVPLTSEIFRGY